MKYILEFKLECIDRYKKGIHIDLPPNARCKDFERSFGIKNNQIAALLSDTISKGKLISSKYHESNGIVGYRSEYYYQGQYMIVYGIAENG